MAEVELLHRHADLLYRRAGGLNPPSSVIKTWPRPNHHDPESRGWGGASVLIVFAALTTMVFGARIWARMFVSKNAGLDDLIMSIAMVPLIGLTVASVLGMFEFIFSIHLSLNHCRHDNIRIPVARLGPNTKDIGNISPGESLESVSPLAFTYISEPAPIARKYFVNAGCMVRPSRCKRLT